MSVSPRDIIVREIVTNLLIHREYSSPMPGKLIVDADGLRTENASRSFFEGRLTLDEFNPMSKNPIIAGFFTEIGLADELGSGMRNLYKYSKIYTGKEPELIDGDEFKAFVPVAYVDTPSSRGPATHGGQASAGSVDEARSVKDVILDMLDTKVQVTSHSVAAAAHVTVRTANRYLLKYVSSGVLVVAAKKGKFKVYERSTKNSDATNATPTT